MDEHKARMQRLRGLQTPIPLFKRMEQRYRQEYEEPEKERERQAIQEQRVKFRSVSKDDLVDHQQRVKLWYEERNM